MGYACKIYMTPGPDGGNTMVVESGGVIQFATSGCIEINGEALTATAAELNLLSGAGAGIASGTQVANIADIANDANGTQIATAVNSILAALLEFGIMAAAE